MENFLKYWKYRFLIIVVVSTGAVLYRHFYDSWGRWFALAPMFLIIFYLIDKIVSQEKSNNRG